MNEFHLDLDSKDFNIYEIGPYNEPRTVAYRIPNKYRELYVNSLLKNGYAPNYIDQDYWHFTKV